MIKQILKLQSKVFYLLGIIFTFLNFLAFLISRNNNFVQNPGRAWTYASATEFRNYPASEFERTLSCYAFGQCYRIGGGLIAQPIIYLGDLLSKFYFWNVDDQARIFIIQTVGLSWRIACVGIITYVVLEGSQNLAFALSFVNALLFALSGWLLRLVGEVINIVPVGLSAEFKARSVSAFQDFPYENLQWYDFGLFAVLSLIVKIVLNYSSKNISTMKVFFFSVLITSMFEYLGFVFAVAWILFESQNRSEKLFSKRNLFTGIKIGLGSITWLLITSIYFRISKFYYPKFFEFGLGSDLNHTNNFFRAIQQPIENITNNPSILFQILLVIFQSAFMGMFLGFIARLCFKNIHFTHHILSAFGFVAIATAFVMFFNLFIAYGVEVQAAEHSRQTLGLQIALFTYLFLRTAAGKKIISVPVAID